MTEPTDEQKRYNQTDTELANQQAEDFRDTAKKVEPHTGEHKVTRSTKGSVEKTTRTDKS